MPSLQQFQSLERRKVFHGKRRGPAALPLQRLRLSVRTALDYLIYFLFFFATRNLSIFTEERF